MPLVDARGVTIGVAKNMIFLTDLHWPICMWHPHLRSNVQRHSVNQKIFWLCSLEQTLWLKMVDGKISQRQRVKGQLKFKKRMHGNLEENAPDMRSMKTNLIQTGL